MKTNRKALLTSVVSLIICVTMLIGTTFAWFTDTASTKVSKIQAGTLKVELWGADVKDGKVGELTNIGNESKALFDYNLWEPGYTSYKVVEIKNVGNLAFEYALDVTRNLGNDDTNVATILPDVIDVYFNIVDEVPKTLDREDYKEWTKVSLADVLKSDNDGVVHGVLLPKGATADNSGYEMVENVYAVIALHMQESAGNDYMNLTEKFDIKLYAKQWTEEFDSESDQYDKDATYDATRKPVEECNHTETKLVPNSDGTHNVVCANGECNKVITENVPCDLTKHYEYSGQPESSSSPHVHKAYCECGYFDIENCTPQEGECTKCGHNAEHVHSYGDWVSNNDGTHSKTCACEDVVTENCTYGTDGKCTVCGGNKPTPTAATLTTVTGTVNIPGIDVSKLKFELYRGSNNLASAFPDENGNLTFTDFNENLSKNVKYDVKFNSYEALGRLGITGVSDNVEFTVEVELDETTNTYKIKTGTDSFEYKSGYTKTIAKYDFEDGNIPEANTNWFAGNIEITDNPSGSGKVFKSDNRMNIYGGFGFNVGKLEAGTYTVSVKGYTDGKCINSNCQVNLKNCTCDCADCQDVVKFSFMADTVANVTSAISSNKFFRSEDYDYTKNSWQTFTYQFSVDADQSEDICICIDNNGSSCWACPFVYYIDDFELIQTVPTPTN